jgi:hypothetical protein
MTPYAWNAVVPVSVLRPVGFAQNSENNGAPHLPNSAPACPPKDGWGFFFDAPGYKGFPCGGSGMFIHSFKAKGKSVLTTNFLWNGPATNISANSDHGTESRTDLPEVWG